MGKVAAGLLRWLVAAAAFIALVWIAFLIAVSLVPSSLSGTDVQKLFAFAALILAAATTITAATNVLAVRAANRQGVIAREALESAHAAVAASDRRAVAPGLILAELRLDRAIEYRPYVVFSIAWTSDGVTILVQNIGRGPALDCVVAYHAAGAPPASDLWGSSAPFALGSLADRSIQIVAGENEARAQLFSRDLTIRPDSAVVVAAYGDLRGLRFRGVLQGHEFSTQSWREDQGWPIPDWVTGGVGPSTETIGRASSSFDPPAAP